VVKELTLGELVHVYDVRRLLEVDAAGLGAQQITPTDCDKMQTEYDLMRTAIAEGRVVALLDHDEALAARTTPLISSRGAVTHPERSPTPYELDRQLSSSSSTSFRHR
jgi:hypothetical protein